MRELKEKYGSVFTASLQTYVLTDYLESNVRRKLLYSMMGYESSELTVLKYILSSNIFVKESLRRGSGKERDVCV